MTDVRVVVGGDDFTFGEDKVRGTFGSERNDQRVSDILGRRLRWTDDGLECEADEKHPQTFLRGAGLNEESQMVSSAAIKAEAVDPKEDEELLWHEIEKLISRSLGGKMVIVFERAKRQAIRARG